MLQEFEDSIAFLRLPNIKTTDITEENGCHSWDNIGFRSFVEGFMSEFDITDDKSSVAAYLPVRFKPEKDWVLNDKENYRIDENIEEITILVLDLDSKDAIKKAEEVFSKYEYFVHTTHSRTKANPDKCRMLVKLEHPIPQAEWKPFVNKIIPIVGADPSCSNPSRGFFFPSYIDKNNPENTEKYIKPYTKENAGRALTVEDVEKLSKDYQKWLRQEGKVEALKKYLSNTSEKTQIEGKRHPAGGIVKDNVVYSQVDTSYERYVKDHMGSIKDHLVDGRRHNFALSAIMREFVKYKDMVDINSLTMFIYKAAEDYSDSYLYMEGSPSQDRKLYTNPQDFIDLKYQRQRRDTPDELHELISSAVNSTSNMTRPSSYFTARLDAAKQNAQMASHTNKWLFRKPKKVTKENDINANPLDLYLDKCEPCIKAFNETKSFNSQKWNDLVHGVLDGVTDKEEAYYRAQLIMKVVDDFYRDNKDVFKRGIIEDAFNKELGRVSKDLSKANPQLKRSILTGFQSYKSKMTQFEGSYHKNEKSPHP